MHKDDLTPAASGTVPGQGTADGERLLRATKMMSEAMHNMVVANQSAWIEWQHGAGAEAAMRWVHNGLVGPGHIPDETAPYGKEAQAWYDANNANPLPACFCGRPSSIGWMGRGFCCDEHYERVKVGQGAASPMNGADTARAQQDQPNCPPVSNDRSATDAGVGVVDVLMAALQWHRADLWRDDGNAVHRSAWEEHENNLRAAIKSATGGAEKEQSGSFHATTIPSGTVPGGAS